MIDCNASLGSWPFGTLPNTTPASLVRVMDSLAIAKSIVASLEAALYTDVREANRLLCRKVKRHRNRLIPFGVINPKLPGWRYDLKECADDLHMKGVRLMPNCHGYAIEDDCCLSLLETLTKRNMPVQILHRLMDPRVQNPTCQIQDTRLLGTIEIAKQFPKLRICLLSAVSSGGALVSGGFTKAIGESDHVFLDIARAEGVGCIDRLTENIGTEHILFGTGAPLLLPLSAVYKLKESSLSEKDIRNITHANARRFLGDAL